jgi:hypothetical protein
MEVESLGLEPVGPLPRPGAEAAIRAAVAARLPTLLPDRPAGEDRSGDAA